MSRNNGLHRRQHDRNVVFAAGLGQQPATAVVNRQQGLARCELRSRAAGRVSFVLAFVEIVGERGPRDLDDCSQGVIDTHVQRARQQHVNQRD
jgi:hypothetical protein